MLNFGNRSLYPSCKNHTKMSMIYRSNEKPQKKTFMCPRDYTMRYVHWKKNFFLKRIQWQTTYMTQRNKWLLSDSRWRWLIVVLTVALCIGESIWMSIIVIVVIHLEGFKPFGNSSQQYSSLPIIVTPYNLPPWMCMRKP